MFKPKPTRSIYALLLLCGLALSACGGGPSEPSSQASTLPELPMGCEPAAVPDGDFKTHMINSAAHMRMLLMGILLLIVLRFSPRGLLPEK